MPPDYPRQKCANDHCAEEAPLGGMCDQCHADIKLGMASYDQLSPSERRAQWDSLPGFRT